MVPVDDPDKQAFLDAMAQVTRLHQEQPRAIGPSKSRSKPNVVGKLTSKTATLPDVIRPLPYLSNVSADDVLSYQHPSIPQTNWRRFCTGKIKRDLTLDLHGFTLIKAEQAMEAFMEQAQTQSLQQLLIIHGKGSHDGHTPPVLKNWLWRWLRHCPAVLAIHSAPTYQGGSGAVLVWLRRRKPR